MCIRDRINEGEKAAVIGINGAGKTTLFKIITGEYEADHGEVIFQKGSTYGYLSQVIDVSSHRSIYEAVSYTHLNYESFYRED